MHKTEKQVKSKGKVLATITVDAFDTLKEASDKLGAEKALSMINKSVADSAANAERTARTRTSSPTAQLARLAKENPNVEEEIKRMIAKFQAKAAAQATA